VTVPGVEPRLPLVEAMRPTPAPLPPPAEPRLVSVSGVKPHLPLVEATSIAAVEPCLVSVSGVKPRLPPPTLIAVPLRHRIKTSRVSLDGSRCVGHVSQKPHVAGDEFRQRNERVLCRYQV